MDHNVIELIVKHLLFFDYALICSDRILDVAKSKNIDRVEFEMTNRDRIINMLGKLQSIIEEEIGALDPATVTDEILDILKSWMLEINQLIDKIDGIDQAILKALNQEKEQTTREIATIYENKQKFKGYNLNNVKK